MYYDMYCYDMYFVRPPLVNYPLIRDRSLIMIWGVGKLNFLGIPAGEVTFLGIFNALP